MTEKERYRIEGEGHDELGQRYLAIAIPDSKLAPIVVATDALVADPTRVFASLSNAGVNCFSTERKREVLDKLQSSHVKKANVRVATRIGYRGRQFILPDQMIGPSKIPSLTVFDRLDPTMVAKYRTRGTLEEWQSFIARPALGNSRLMFAVALGLTGPILRDVQGPRTGGFQISGPAETGKTTASMVAGSVWGCHVGAERREKGFIESWHTTAGKVELTAIAHNETFLGLDETQRAGRDAKQRGQVITDVIFALSEGVERERLTNAKPARGWRNYFLSTSNRTLSELAVDAGIQIDDAYLGRMFDIPCPNAVHGLYETLGDCENGEQFTDALKGRCRRYYGTAGREFVQRVVDDRNKDRKGHRARLARYRARYRKAMRVACRAERLSSLKRVSSRLATVYAAGRLAVRYGILPWSHEELLKAISECQLAGLRQLVEKPKVVGESEAVLRAKLVAYLRENRASFHDLRTQYLPFNKAGRKAVPGYIGREQESGWLYMTSKAVRAVIGTNPSAIALKDSLIREGLLAKPQQGYVVQRRILTGDKGNRNFSWVCAFAPEIVG